MGPAAATHAFEVVRRVRLPTGADTVRARVTTPGGIADELRPVLRMTVPPGLRGGLTAVRVGEPAGRAWILLGGLLPVECDDLVVADLGEHSFTERSSLLTLRTWEHHRVVSGVPGGGCEVTDTLRGSLRGPLGVVPGAAALARSLVSALFAHRHRRLRRWAGGGTPGGGRRKPPDDGSGERQDTAW